MFNWFIGNRLYNSKLKRHFYISDEWYARVKRIFNTYLIFLLLFSWAPLCKMLLVLAGFLETRLIIVFPLVVIGQIFNYVWPLL